MYGLVNRAIEEMAIQVAGQEIWEAIKLKAGVEETTFLSMQAYPDKITYDLVEAASEILEVPADDLLRQFGKHWILFTAQEGYGSLLEASGSDLREFIENLDTMHSRIATTMPELNPPSFECEENAPDLLTIRYFSDREGLAPMVVGLLEGLGEMFNTPIFVEHEDTKREKGYDTFNVKYQTAIAV